MSDLQSYELRNLIQKIRLNKATEDDYKEYEKILVSKGFTKEQISKKLTDSQIYGYDDLVKERQQAESNLPRRQTIQTVVVAGLIAFGLYLLLRDDE